MRKQSYKLDEFKRYSFIIWTNLTRNDGRYARQRNILCTVHFCDKLPIFIRNNLEQGQNNAAKITPIQSNIVLLTL